MLIASLLALLPLAQANLPDPAVLIRNAIAADEAQDAKNERFTFREDEARTDEKGHPIKGYPRVYDNIMLEGENYRKLILIDGQPLDSKAAKKVLEDLEQTRQQRRKHKLTSYRKTIAFPDLDQLTRLFDSKVTGEETVAGRKAWRVESEPRAGAKAASPDEEEILATHRVTWFDQEEGVEVRRHTTYVRAVHKIQAGTRDELEWSKVGDTWQLSSQFFHGDVRLFPGVHIANDARYRYYDYKRFSAESTFTPN